MGNDADTVPEAHAAAAGLRGLWCPVLEDAHLGTLSSCPVQRAGTEASRGGCAQVLQPATRAGPASFSGPDPLESPGQGEK